MAELTIGDPFDYATDVGPVIDDEATQSARGAQGADGGARRRRLLDLQLPAGHEARDLRLARGL